VEFVNHAGRLGFPVADVNEPRRVLAAQAAFVAVVVLVGLRAVEENTSPKSGVGWGVVQFKCVVGHGD